MKRVPVRLPHWGLTMDHAVVIEWLTPEGTSVEKGAVLLTVETDKATADVESPSDGKLVSIAVNPGDSVAPGDLLAEIESE